MTNTKAKAKTPQSDAKERAQSIIEGYHEGNNMEDRLLRKEVIISMLICIVSSEWWTGMMHDQRMHIIHHMVQVDDTMDALDVMYG